MKQYPLSLNKSIPADSRLEATLRAGLADAPEPRQPAASWTTTFRASGKDGKVRGIEGGADAWVTPYGAAGKGAFGKPL